MSLQGNLCNSGPVCAEVLFQPSFSLCRITRCLRNMRHPTRWFVVWSGERSTLRITERDTAQTERILMRLVGHLVSRQPFASVKQKECLHLIHDMTPVPSCCLCQCCTYNSLSFLNPYFAHGTGAPGCSVFDPRQYIMTTTDELLARLINLESEAVQARQRQSSAEQALAVAQQSIQQFSSGSSAPTTSAGVIDTRTHGKPKSVTGQTAEWTTWQFTFKAFACAAHPKMKEVFDLSTRKGADLVVNSDMTVELQLFITQLYYVLVMMPSDQAQEIVRNSPERCWYRSVAQVALGV